MTESVGREIRRAMPITMTFYDWLGDYPYTSTFYVKHDTPDEDANRLIASIQTMSQCVLGKYKIGYRPFIILEASRQLEKITPEAQGTQKWRISYRVENFLVRSHTIPGFKLEHTMALVGARAGKNSRYPNLDHPDWKAFLAVFREVAVTESGKPIPNDIEVKPSFSNWPPKGAKKR